MARSQPVEAWHTIDPETAARKLDVDPARGLDPAAVAERRERHGANVLASGPTRGPWRILGEQLRSTLILLLVVAAIVSAAIGEVRDAIVILAIVVLNTLLGFVQDYRAERAMAALQRLSEPRVRVRRGGTEERIEARDLVPGDLVLLAAGDRVAADARVVEAHELQADESALTGESNPVTKTTEAIDDPELPLGDRASMVHQGTLITRGRAEALVVATGMATELGEIAGLLQGVGHQPTPLQRRLSRLGRDLSLAAVALVVLIVVGGVASGQEPRLMLMVGLALAVAAVPEGLPAVATLALALGARRMLARHALIRRLPAVETLGSVTTICSDKTGTLTRNQMRVTALEALDGAVDLAGDAGDAPDVTRASVAWSLLVAGACHDIDPAVLAEDDAGGGDAHAGDPTEIALARCAERFGLDVAWLDVALPRRGEAPFDAERRRMSTLHEVAPRGSGDGWPAALSPLRAMLDATADVDGPALVLTKGAVDAVLDVSSAVLVDGEERPLDEATVERVHAAEESLADRGMRVLGLAGRRLDAPPSDPDDPEQLERDLVFLGLVGLADPLRPHARDAVEQCRRAGIRPLMITGDHPRTAVAIARQAGIAVEGRVIEGRRLASLDDAALDAEVESLEVFARVSPEDKLRIVDSLARRGQVVAMTGDGVNDAPSLRRADIGVAMGKVGTDVARDAADMVLLDDDFGTIVAAVRQGRRVYDNIRRFLVYTLASNTGEIVTMVAAPLLGLPLALLPLQILWINLVTDGLPGLALGVEREERGVMRRPPVSPDARLLDAPVIRAILAIGLLMGAISLGAGVAALHWGTSETAGDEGHWRTVIFTVLTLSQMGNALALRSFREGFFSRSPWSSPGLAGAVLLTFGLQAAVVYLPFLQAIFHTVPLTLGEWLACCVAGTLVFWAVEVGKWWRRR